MYWVIFEHKSRRYVYGSYDTYAEANEWEKKLKDMWGEQAKINLVKNYCGHESSGMCET